MDRLTLERRQVWVYLAAIIAGLLLVLLMPCTDWFITFSQLGHGNVPRAIAIAPVNLLVQLLLLPLYLWLMLGADLSPALAFGDVWPALLVVLAPLAAAAFSQRWIAARAGRAVLQQYLAWWPVPLLALVVFMVAGAQANALRGSLGLFPLVVPLCAAYLVAAALVARGLSWIMRLPVTQGRTLAFSLGTRNSFVVLPFALSLPAGWRLAAVVIVLQSLVELFGMVFYLRWIPNRLFRPQP